MKNENIISLLNKELKFARKQLEEAIRDDKEFGHFDDCGEFYRENVVKAKTRIQTMIYIRGCIKKKMDESNMFSSQRDEWILENK